MRAATDCLTWGPSKLEGDIRAVVRPILEQYITYNSHHHLPRDVRPKISTKGRANCFFCVQGGGDVFRVRPAQPLTDGFGGAIGVAARRQSAIKSAVGPSSRLCGESQIQDSSRWSPPGPGRRFGFCTGQKQTDAGAR